MHIAAPCIKVDAIWISLGGEQKLKKHTYDIYLASPNQCKPTDRQRISTVMLIHTIVSLFVHSARFRLSRSGGELLRFFFSLAEMQWDKLPRKVCALLLTN